METQSHQEKELARVTEEMDLESLSDLSAPVAALLEDHACGIVARVFSDKISALSGERVFRIARAFSSPDKKIFPFWRALPVESEHIVQFLAARYLSTPVAEEANVIEKQISAVLSKERLAGLAAIREGDWGRAVAFLSPSPLVLVVCSHLRHKMADLHRPQRMRAVKILGAFAKNSEAVIPFLIETLADKSSQVCTAAAAALGGLAPGSIPYLKMATTANDTRMRIAAVWALGKIQTGREIAAESVIQCLSDKDDPVRGAAINALIDLGETAIAGLLPKLGEDLPDDALVAGLKAVQQWGKSSPQMISTLLRLVGHPQPEVRIEVLRAFRKIDTPQSIPAVLTALGDPSEEVCLAGIETLASLPYQMDPAIEPLLILSQSEKLRLREASVTALGKLGKYRDEVLDRLLAMLDDADLSVRAAAVRAIGRREARGKKALPALFALLSSAEEILQIAALEAIAHIGREAADGLPTIVRLISWDKPVLTSQALVTMGALGENSINPLMRLIENTPARYRKFLCRAFLAIGSMSIPALARAMADGSQVQRAVASQVLGQMGPSAVSPLIQVLYHEDFWVRKAAAKTLLSIGRPAVGPLMDVVRDGHMPARESAYQLLKGLKGKSLASLICAIKDPKPQLSQFALKIFEKIDPEYAEAVPELLPLVRHPQPLIRQAAIWSLGKIGSSSRAVIEALKKALEDPDPDVRRASQQAILQISGFAGEE